MHVCMWSLASSVQAEIYRVRSFWSTQARRSIPAHAIPLASRLRPLATHRGAAQGATAEEVFSRPYSDLLQHFANGVECKSLTDLHEHDGIALWALNAMSFHFLNIQISCGSLHFCMCGKDPWLKCFFLFLEQRLEISRIGLAKGAPEGGYAAII